MISRDDERVGTHLARLSRSGAKLILAALSAFGCLYCDDPTLFGGTDGVLAFTSSLEATPQVSWTPAMRVARGSWVKLCVASLAGTGGGDLPVLGGFSIAAGDLQHWGDDGSGCFVGLVDSPEPVEIKFTGEAYSGSSSQTVVDQVELTTAQVAGARFATPTLLAPEYLSDVLLLDPETAGPPLGDTLYLAPGPPLVLDVAVIDADGAALGFAASDVTVIGAGGVRVLETGNGYGQAHLAADATVEGTDVPIAIRWQGVEVAVPVVRVESPQAVETLLLGQGMVGGRILLKATAILPSGEPLHQAPFAWQVDDDVEVSPLADYCSVAGDLCGVDLDGRYGLHRTDLLVLDPMISVPGPRGPEPVELVRTVGVSLGDLHQQVSVTFFGVGIGPSLPESLAGHPAGGCAASQTDAFWGLAIASLLTLLGRRQRVAAHVRAAGCRAGIADKGSPA